jgi:hypothetical protein
VRTWSLTHCPLAQFDRTGCWNVILMTAKQTDQLVRTFSTSVSLSLSLSLSLAVVHFCNISTYGLLMTLPTIEFPKGQSFVDVSRICLSRYMICCLLNSNSDKVFSPGTCLCMLATSKSMHQPFLNLEVIIKNVGLSIFFWDRLDKIKFRFRFKASISQRPTNKQKSKTNKLCGMSRTSQKAQYISVV